MKTRREEADELTPRWGERGAEFLAGLHGLARHHDRVARTIRAALAHCWAEDESAPKEVADIPIRYRIDVAGEILADMHGIGGVGGSGTPIAASQRPAPWAAGLGSGRWQAGDGAAWKAASREAVDLLLRPFTGVALAPRDGRVVLLARLTSPVEQVCVMLPEWGSAAIARAVVLARYDQGGNCPAQPLALPVDIDSQADDRAWGECC
jgi:hypothetical protein